MKSPRKNAFIREFETFINQGNVMDLAVGMVMGTAFTKIVNSLVSDIITPLAGILMGGIDFTSLSIDVPNIFGGDSIARLTYGQFIQNVVDFLIVAFCLFLVVKTLNKMREHAKKFSAKNCAAVADKNTSADGEKSTAGKNSKASAKTKKSAKTSNIKGK